MPKGKGVFTQPAPFHTLICYLPLALLWFNMLEQISDFLYLGPETPVLCNFDWSTPDREHMRDWTTEKEWLWHAVQSLSQFWTILLLHQARLFFGMQYICLLFQFYSQWGPQKGTFLPISNVISNSKVEPLQDSNKRNQEFSAVFLCGVCICSYQPVLLKRRRPKASTKATARAARQLGDKASENSLD